MKGSTLSRAIAYCQQQHTNDPTIEKMDSVAMTDEASMQLSESSNNYF
jgi:hypothetical protein